MFETVNADYSAMENWICTFVSRAVSCMSETITEILHKEKHCVIADCIANYVQFKQEDVALLQPIQLTDKLHEN